MGGLIRHSGRVEAIARGQAHIAVATSACSSCGHAGACGVGKLADMNGKRRESLIALPADGLRVGQRVTLELDEARLTQAALLGYLLPTVLLLLGATLGEFVGPIVAPKVGAGETAAAIGAALGLLLGLLLTRLRAPLSPRLTQEPHDV